MIPKTIYLFILVELIAISFVDLRSKKIINIWPIFNILIFIGFLFYWPELYKLHFQTFFYSISFLFVGYLLFLLRIMGGGDAKLLFSLFLIIPIAIQLMVFKNLLISTVIIGLNFFFYNIFKHRSGIAESIKNQNIRGLKQYFGSKFPFAPVILVSWLFTGYDLKIWEK